MTPHTLARSQWDICANSFTKPQLSPTKISPGLKSMWGNSLSRERRQRGCLWKRGGVGSALDLEMTRWQFVDTLHLHHPVCEKVHHVAGWRWLQRRVERDLQHIGHLIPQSLSLDSTPPLFNNQWLGLHCQIIQSPVTKYWKWREVVWGRRGGSCPCRGRTATSRPWTIPLKAFKTL